MRPYSRTKAGHVRRLLSATALAATALAGVSLPVALPAGATLLLGLSRPALAAGGAGGAGAPGVGGAGGTGGGGGAHRFVGTGLPTATSTGGAGGAGGGGGVIIGNGGGGGGGGGGYGAVVTGSNLTGTIGFALTGGFGGAGGLGGDGNGGDGGAGGVGLSFTGANNTVTIDGSIAAGNGGNGGPGGTVIGGGGGGGSGGAGISGDGLNLTVNGAISGGNGGVGGTAVAGVPGGNGAGGAGIVGQDLTITMGATGTVSGGVSGGGVQADAVTFTGGGNFLTFGGATSGLTGNIGVTDSLTLGQSIGVTATTVSNAIVGTGSVVKTGAGAITLSGTNTYGGGTTVNAGTLAVGNNSALGTGAVTLDPGTTLHLENVQIANTVNVSGDPNIAVTGATSLNTVAGSGDVNILGTSGNAANDVLTLNGPNAYTAATFVGDGTSAQAATLRGGAANALSANSATTVTASGILDLGGFDQTVGSLAGTGKFYLGADELTVGGNDTSTIVSGVISDCGATGNDCFDSGTTGGSLVKVGTGTLTLSGANTYTGATTIDAGSLLVNGSIASTLTTVNAGGILGGTGTVNGVTVNSGGVFAPGDGTPNSHMTVNGTLDFSGGGSYRVVVNPTHASSATVSGTATLTGGTVNAVFSPGSYTAKQYTILTANALSGTFAGLTTTSQPGNITSSLSYDADNVYLNLVLAFAVPGGLNGNRQAVADALTGFFDSTGGIPGVFTTLTGDQLTQGSGEVGADTTQTSFDAMNMFLNMLFGGDHGSATGGSGGGALGYANSSSSDEARKAYAAVTPKDRLPVKAAAPFAARWSVWAGGYGGSSTVDGNSTVGSHDTTSRIYGMAAGADYRLSPNTLIGFALGGAGFNFGLSDGLGSGRADLFQAGLYGRHWFGPAYVAGALAYGWQDVKTSRTVTISGNDDLDAEFHANTFAARGETGYRFATPWVGVTPYAALQATSFRLPSYAESATSGSDTFALTYNSQTTTNVRTELGARFDKSLRVTGGLLTLRSRLAWAHDSDTDRAVTAAFQTLPGAAFTVNGASPDADSALVSAGAEMRWANGFSLAANFEGEFSGTTQGYAGKGTLRYVW